MNLGNAFIEILPNLKRWGTRLRSDIVKASEPGLAEGERKFSGFATRVKNSLFSMRGAMAAAMGAGAVGVVGRWALGTASALQQAQISFETMLGSAKEATAFMGDLKKFAAATPFELPGLIEAARQLVGAGTAAKDVIPTLRAYGDASGALGLNQEQFKRIMLATTQAMNKGKLQAEELMQITEAGIPVYPLLSRALGMPVAKIQELASQGKLLSKDVLPKLQAEMSKEFGGAMARQATTLSGLWSTFMDTLHLGLSDAIQPLIPTLGVLLPAATARLGAGLKAAGIGLAAFVAGLRGQQTTVGGVVGGIQNAALAIRDTAAAAIEAGRVLFGFYHEHQLLVETTTAAIVSMWLAFRLYRFAVAALAAVRFAMFAFRASVISTTVAMMANPFGLVVLAIVGLVAALVVAYKRSETFRDVVNGAWASIKQAVSVAIAFLQPYWVSFITAMKQVGSWVMWLWHTAIVPAFNGIMVAVHIAIDVIGVYIKAWILAIKVVATVISWLYTNVVKPIFTVIGIAVKVFYALFQVYVGLITIAVKVLGNYYIWLWRSAIAPALRGIGAVVVWLYQNIVKPYFTLIGMVIQTVWRTVIKPTFDVLRDVIQNKIAPAFTNGVNAIRAAWAKVQDAAKAPVRFVVNTIVNGGIIDTFNKIAGVFGVSKVAHVALPKGFATGGKFSTPTAIVGEGNTSSPEYVIPTDPKYRNRAVALYSELGTKLMQDGGIVGKIGGFVGNLGSALSDPGAMLKRVVSRLIGGVPGGGLFRTLVTKLPDKVVSVLTHAIGNIFGNVEVPGGGYQGGGGGSYAGLVAFGRWLQTMGYTVSEHPAFGGVTMGAHVRGSKHYIGHAIDVNRGAGTSATEQRALAKIIGPAHAAGFRTIFMAPGHYNHAHVDFDSGGLLPPGLTMAYNGTRHNERVLPTDNLETTMYQAFMRALVDGGVGAVEVNVDGEELKKVIRVEAKNVNATSAAALKVGRR
jgi:tape measure domain-containing protein